MGHHAPIISNTSTRPGRQRLHRLLRLISAILPVAALALVAAGCGRAPSTIVVPTPDCGEPTLAIGAAKFRIETLQPKANGSLALPPDTNGVAYWVSGTTTNQVFLIGAAPDNTKSMAALLPSIAGVNATVTWRNCNATSYALEAAQDGAYNVSPLPEQSTPGITILFAQRNAGVASIVHGALAGETITTIDTPAGGAATIQAEISLLDTTTSTDGKTVRIGVSIRNTGAGSFKLTSDDVSLAAQDGAPSRPVRSEPALPQTIKRGATQTIYLTFPRPASPTATLKVLDVEYDIEGY